LQGWADERSGARSKFEEVALKPRPRSDGRWARWLGRLLLVVLLWLGLCGVALMLSGGWPRTRTAWLLVLGLGPPAVLFTDVVGEILMSPVKNRGNGIKVAVFLLVSFGTILFATWAQVSQSFGRWWRTNFGGG
jgi:hypothetical protein